MSWDMGYPDFPRAGPLWVVDNGHWYLRLGVEIEGVQKRKIADIHTGLAMLGCCNFFHLEL